MYFFVPYNISPIQQAIQAGHASLEYVRRFGLTPDLVSFMDNDKTWIILNGGTTNSGLDAAEKPQGTLNLLHEDLWTADIKHSIFYEPDLNNALTAICFLADEQVWDYENYPDFRTFVIEEIGIINSDYIQTKMRKIEEDLQQMYPESYKKWVESLGGEKNVFLRNLLKGKKLA